MKYFVALTFSLALLIFSKAYAYPNMIRHGYLNCMGCHYAPEGGSLLTQYGKGISQAMSFKGGEYTPSESKIVDDITLGGRLHHSIQFRGMTVRRGEPVSGKRYRTFPMQADYINQVDWAPGLRHEIILATAPNTARRRGVDENTNSKSSFTERLYFRTFKLEWMFIKGKKIAVGHDTLPMGLGIADHTAYVRERNRLGVTDVPLQFQFFSVSANWQSALSLFLPNNSDLKNNREKGLMGKSEFAFFRNFAVGLQGLTSNGKSINRRLLGATIRWGIPQFSILAENNYTERHISGASVTFPQWTNYLELGLFPKDYLKIFWNFQALTVSDPFFERERLTGLGFEAHWMANITSLVEARKRWSSVLDEKILMAQIFFNLW